MNEIKWFYCFNADSGDFFEEIERDIPESPSHDELDAIAQELPLFLLLTSCLWSCFQRDP